MFVLDRKSPLQGSTWQNHHKSTTGVAAGETGVKNVEVTMCLNIQEMTTEEKLRAMEMLWDDICRKVPDLASPLWHGDIEG